MKVLVIGQTYVPPINRDKLYYLNKKAEVTLLTPTHWNDDLFVVPGKKDAKIRHYEEKVLLNGHEKACLYHANLVKALLETKPDIIQVDQGANSVTYFETINLNKLLGINAKVCFFTWMNKPYSNPFPFNFLEWYNLKNTDLAVCGNQDAVDLLRAKNYKGPAKVLPLLGVDPKKFSKNGKIRKKVRQKLGIKDEFCIGFFGRLVVEKGVDDLINAASKIKNKKIKLLIIGRGDQKDNLLKLVKELGMEKQVIFMNSVLHDELPDYLRALDLFVLPSKTVPWWKEQFGHVIIEAMSAEVPVIGSTCGEIPNVIGDAGYVFKEGGVSQLADIIQKLAGDKKLLKRTAKKGLSRVLANYTHEIIAEKMYAMYKNMLKK